MVKSTPAPKVTNRQLLLVPYLYAGILILLAGLQLVGFGGFDFAGIALHTQGEPWWILSLVFVEVFALPFLLRLNLSPLARGLSAFLCLLAPILFFLLVAAGVTGIAGQGPDYAISVSMICFACASFSILSGEKVIKLPKKI